MRADTVRLDGRALFPNGKDWRVFFEFTAPEPARAMAATRPFLLAVLPMAMRHGLDVRCDHGIDGTTRTNLTRWMETFARWAPGRLRPVGLHLPESGCTRAPGARGTLQPFSGGVDSCHTLVSRPPGTRHAGLMVHGFDIPHDASDAFERAWAGSSRALHRQGAEAYRLRTNLRARGDIRPGPDWERESHGIWLAAALACLEPWFDSVIIPSTFCHSALTTPWGSHPETDQWLGSEAVPYLHHGAELDKLGKILVLAKHPELADQLRVCWQSRADGGNCGHCFKCCATQVCLWLSEMTSPAAFPDPCTVDELAKLPVKAGSNRYLIDQLMTEARRQERHGLAAALGASLRRLPPGALQRWLSWIKP